MKTNGMNACIVLKKPVAFPIVSFTKVVFVTVILMRSLKFIVLVYESTGLKAFGKRIEYYWCGRLKMTMLPWWGLHVACITLY